MVFILPAPHDNAAIATRTLAAGTEILVNNQLLTLPYTVLEGHRFALQTLHPGDWVTSWGQPFGTVIRPIAPGDYLCNTLMLTALASRNLDIALPSEPNFSDDVPPFVFDEEHFAPAAALPLYAESKTFEGFPRAGGRGVGTRNFVVLLGTSALTGSFVQALEAELKPLAAQYPHLDGIVAVAHTEGGHRQPNNRELVLRTLAGFMVNPNVGAVLAVDRGDEAITNAMLHAYMVEHGYPLDAVPHHFFTLTGQADAEQAKTIVENWLPVVSAQPRRPMPLSHLKIGLQCGGSDAFSGITANPLVGWIAKQIVRYGGSANLAESPELVSAESYVLDKVRDVGTAQQFLAKVERFKTQVGWHGHAVTGNPSGGNLYRGLYNIYLKSLGAATKRDPEVRLDYAIDYGEPMREPGFYFMDSPGNDLESIAGQVAAGCNLILFSTGNGSVTNFPFVPTIKLMTNTPRYELLINEMDINAGAMLEGVSLAELGAQSTQLTLDVASGQKSAGERAGHAQVQLWRDWRLSAPLTMQLKTPVLEGLPLPLRPVESLPTPYHYHQERVGLILPTSLCAGQIARLTVEKLNALGLGRFATLVHTEGCGFSGSPEYINTLLGYLQHPLVSQCLVLEHGCEITHNAFIRQLMNKNGIDPARYGWASIQLDGGLEAVQHKIMAWFAAQVPSYPTFAPLGTLGVMTAAPVDPSLIETVLQVAQGGGTVIIPQHDALLRSEALLQQLAAPLKPTLNYAQRPSQKGLHVMETPLDQWTETLTGLGAAGVEVVVVNKADLPGHPFIPTLAVVPHADIAALLQAPYSPHLAQFQITRGSLGVSL